MLKIKEKKDLDHARSVVIFSALQMTTASDRCCRTDPGLMAKVEPESDDQSLTSFL